MSDITYTCDCGWTGTTPRASVYKGREWLLCPDCWQELGAPWDLDERDADADNDAREGR